jgi:hypothetical protein
MKTRPNFANLVLIVALLACHTSTTLWLSLGSLFQSLHRLGHRCHPRRQRQLASRRLDGSTELAEVRAIRLRPRPEARPEGSSKPRRGVPTCAALKGYLPVHHHSWSALFAMTGGS